MGERTEDDTADQLADARRVLARIQQGPWPDLRAAVDRAEAFLAETGDKWGR